MIPDSGRRSFILSITLTELALLLFFLLLFTAVWQISRAQEDKLVIEQRAASLERQLEGMDSLWVAFAGRDAASMESVCLAAAENMGAVKQNERLQQAMQRMEAERDSLLDRFANFAADLNALELQVEDLQLQRDGMEDLLAQAATEASSDDFTELIRDAARNTVLATAHDTLKERIDALSDEQRRLSAELQGTLANLAECETETTSFQSQTSNLRGQLANLQRRVTQAGLGFPPCWADETGRPEYIFNVYLEEESFNVTPAWPPHREQQVEALAGATELIGRGITIEQFRSRAMPILAWSQNQDPECRHFVRIDDSPQMSKAAFKSNLLLVEDYFYKYLKRVAE